MISIKRFLERSHAAAPADDLLKASARLRELLLSGIAEREHPRHAKTRLQFESISQDLLRLLEEPASASDLVAIAIQTVEAIENDRRGTTDFYDELSTQMQSMVAMLAEALADISGQSDASIARLHGIEEQIERASGLDDIRALGENLATCIAAVKEAAVQQREATRSTVERLRNQIQRATLLPPGVAQPAQSPPRTALSKEVADYVAVFKLQRAEHILSRFGEAAQSQMLSVIAQDLASVQGPQDRLMRWKGPAFLMFLSSPDDVLGVRQRLSKVVAKTSRRYVEIGKSSTLLALGVDWVVYPQAQYPSLEVIFGMVDAFLEKS